MPPYVTGKLMSSTVEVCGEKVTACAVDASPALAVIHGVIEVAPRRPSLVISGINYGANLGTEVTISGTVGAALEAGAFGIPGLAMSLEMDPIYHYTGDDSADYEAAMVYTHQFAQHLLNEGLPHDVQALNINIPSEATPDTPWWLAPLSRRRYYQPTAPDRENGQGRPGYKMILDYVQAERDSDIYTVKVDRIVSVTPLSLDLTSRVDFPSFDACLRGESSECLSLPQPVPIPWLQPMPETMSRY
jgi:5'-nucleotidase